MPSIYDLKPAFQRLLRPLVGGLARARVTPNQITISAAILSAATGAAIACWPGSVAVLVAVPIVLFVRMALNAIDGMLAREHDLQSPLGAFLNEVGDVVSDAALYLPFAFVAGFDAGLVVGVVLLAIISEMTGVVALQVGSDRRYDGPMGKSDRAFLFGALALAAAFLAVPGWLLDAVLWVVIALLALTIMNRTRRALAAGNRRSSGGSR